MENGGFTLVLALALVTCVTPTERKVRGQVAVGTWRTRHWDAVWADRGSLLNAILGWGKQESFADT